MNSFGIGNTLEHGVDFFQYKVINMPDYEVQYIIDQYRVYHTHIRPTMLMHAVIGGKKTICDK
jgi:transposase InsO family protein